jgi:hypothetical protein
MFYPASRHERVMNDVKLWVANRHWQVRLAASRSFSDRRKRL